LFIDFLGSTLGNEESFSREIKASITADLERLRHFTYPDQVESKVKAAEMLPYVKDDLYDRLSNHLISFCRQHPQVIPRPHDPRQYR
jgi:hypothetical protein